VSHAFTRSNTNTVAFWGQCTSTAQHIDLLKVSDCNVFHFARPLPAFFIKNNGSPK
jgi:hypothetical protein